MALLKKSLKLFATARTASAALMALTVSAGFAIAPVPALSQVATKDSFLQLALTEALSMTTKTADFAYRVAVETDEAEVAVYQLASPGTYEIQSYHCHTDLDPSGAVKGAHCHDEGVSAPVTHTLPSQLIDRNSRLTAINSALSIFESRIAKIDTISELKIWQHNDDMTLKVTSGDTASPAVNLFNCHLHGANYDCHRTRKAGPNEPAN